MPPLQTHSLVICEPIVQEGVVGVEQVVPIFAETATKSETSTIPSSVISASESVVPNFVPIYARSRTFIFASEVRSRQVFVAPQLPQSLAQHHLAGQ